MPPYVWWILAGCGLLLVGVAVYLFMIKPGPRRDLRA